MGAGREDPAAGHGVLRISGHQQHLDARPRVHDAPRQFLAVESRHDDVGQQKVDGLGELGAEMLGDERVARFDDAVSGALEHFPDELPDAVAGRLHDPVPAKYRVS